MVVLDTHAWIWWNDDPARLSAAARDAIDASDSIGVPSICCWEVGMLAAGGRADFEPDVSRWIQRALSRAGTIALALSPKVALEAALLEGSGFSGDPADRMIYSSAVDAGAALVTRDARIRDFDPRRTVW